MKAHISYRYIPLATVLCICIASWLTQPAFAIGKPCHTYKLTVEEPKEEKPAKKTKNKSLSSSRNNSSVKIYPDMIKREMHVVSKENEGKDIEFFIFDLEGTLIQNYRMKPKDHIRLNTLKRGKYRYNVFCGDTETAAGEFEIR